MRVIILIAVLFQAASSFSGILDGNPGTTSGQFLLIPVSARASSMGMSYCGLADDMGALEFNPGGLGLLTRSQVSFSYLDYYAGTSMSGVMFAYPSKTFTLAGGYRLFSSEDTSRDALGNETGDFSIRGSEGLLAVSTFLGPVRAGVSAKMVYTRVDDLNAAGAAFDIGALVSIPGSKERYGISVHNIGPGLKVGRVQDPLPLVIRLGASQYIGDFILSWQLSKPKDSRFVPSLGVEYRCAGALLLRGGFVWQDDVDITCGMGFRLRSVRIDYAFLPTIYLGSTHRFTMGVEF